MGILSHHNFSSISKVLLEMKGALSASSVCVCEYRVQCCEGR